MKIVCTIQRPGGTELTLGKNTYHFKEDEDGLHACEVKDEDDIDCLLNIPESFKEYGHQDDVEPEPEPEVEPELDPEAMTNEELNAWAKEAGINPKSKKEIQDYVENNTLDVTFLANDNLASMLRKTLTADLEAEQV